MRQASKDLNSLLVALVSQQGQRRHSTTSEPMMDITSYTTVGIGNHSLDVGFDGIPAAGCPLRDKHRMESHVAFQPAGQEFICPGLRLPDLPPSKRDNAAVYVP